MRDGCPTGSLLPLCTALVFLAASGLARADMRAGDRFVNSVGMDMVRVEPGSFRMGARNGDRDEKPEHRVRITRSFYMAATEVTNEQYEKFDPEHEELRGRKGFSSGDREAAVFVSWHDAVAFCEWLSEREGRPYRLPTEAEWEYACRAGTSGAYHTGEKLPSVYHKKQGHHREPEPVDLTVGTTPANPWGLHEMHGNVEEWCSDWYGPYPTGPDGEATSRVDPVGCASGSFRVTRGGNHNTKLHYLRSANRSGALPGDRHWLIGFRVVCGRPPSGEPTPPPEPPRWARDVQQEEADWADGPDPETPYFRGPLPYVRIPEGSDGPLYSHHNHDPALTWCENGHLLAIWYSCRNETGRELSIAASRLREGAAQWETADVFWNAPDRNDHAPSLWHGPEGRLYHFNGLSAGAGFRRNLALIMRTSDDNGARWSEGRLINPNRGLASQPVTTVFEMYDGRAVLPVDAPWRRKGGATALWFGRNSGERWELGKGAIAGIHAAVCQLENGHLLAFGRRHEIDGRMPKSISTDRGESWSVSASPFPPIGANQRPVLIRLREGPLLFLSFTHDFFKYRDRVGEAPVMEATGGDGNTRRIFGMFAAVSFDEGKSWPVRRPVTPGGPAREVTYFDHATCRLDETHAEPRGYLDACQTPDGLIHVITSKNYYSFNLAWLRQRTSSRSAP